MADDKEFREFFTRTTPVTSGPKPDQEIGYPTEYTVGTRRVSNRFVKDAFPSASIFKKLFNSVTFKLNPEDKATTTDSGLSRAATDAQVLSETPNPGLSFTIFVAPDQLPKPVGDTVVGDTEVSSTSNNGIKIDKVTRSNKRVWRFSTIVSRSISIVANALQLVGDEVAPAEGKFYGLKSGLKGWHYPRLELTLKSVQSGTGNPVFTIIANNTGVNYSAVRTGVGTYRITASGNVFDTASTRAFSSLLVESVFVVFSVIDTTTLDFSIKNTAGAATDNHSLILNIVL